MNQQEMLKKAQADNALSNWREQEKTALELLQIVGELRFDRSVDLILFRYEIYDSRPSEVIQLHRNSMKYSKKLI